MTAAPGLDAVEVEGFAAVDARGLLAVAEDINLAKINTKKLWCEYFKVNFRRLVLLLFMVTHQSFWV